MSPVVERLKSYSSNGVRFALYFARMKPIMRFGKKLSVNRIAEFGIYTRHILLLYRYNIMCHL